MRERDLVSIIIPCYNQARFLGEAIESALAQTYPRHEVIVVDDGSTDGTHEVAAGYEGVECVRQGNEGLAAARNAGLVWSRGEYVVFLDADDRLLPDALEVGIRAFDERPESAFVAGHVRLISEDGSALPPPPTPRVGREVYVELLRHNFIWTPGSVMYRRGIVDSASGFDTSVDGSADFDLNVRIASRSPVYYHGRVVLEYRKHSSNMTRRAAVMLKASVTVRRAHRKYVRGNKEYEEALESGIRSVQEGYGEKLIEEVSTDIRLRRWSRALAGGFVLLRYYPAGILARAGRKLHPAASGAKR